VPLGSASAGGYSKDGSRAAAYTTSAMPATSSAVVDDAARRPGSAPESRTARWAWRDNSDPRDSDDNTDPALRKLPIDNTDPKEPTLARLPHDPTLATDSTDPRDAMDRTLSVDHSDHLDPEDGDPSERMLMEPPCSPGSHQRKTHAPVAEPRPQVVHAVERRSCPRVPPGSGAVWCNADEESGRVTPDSSSSAACSGC